jgi:hypothetical protein
MNLAVQVAASKVSVLPSADSLAEAARLREEIAAFSPTRQDALLPASNSVAAGDLDQRLRDLSMRLGLARLQLQAGLSQDAARGLEEIHNEFQGLRRSAAANESVSCYVQFPAMPADEPKAVALQVAVSKAKP